MIRSSESGPGSLLQMAALPLAVAACLSLPLYLPIPGLEHVPLLAMGVAILSIPVLCAQLSVDALVRGPGTALRLMALLLVVAATAAWISGILTFGANGGAALSYLNWIALVGMMVTGQLFLGTPRRIAALLDIWASSYAAISVGVVAYLALRFGGEIFTTTNRVPFQAALRNVFMSWPNYFGLALAVSVCIVYGRILTGARGILPKIQLLALVAGLAATFSRGAYLACAFGIVVMTFKSGSRLRASLMLVAGACVVALALAFMPAARYQFVATFIPGTSQNLGLLERMAFAQEALTLWLENPTFGIGFNRFADFSDESRVYAEGFLLPSTLGSVHNEFVTMLLKGGWVGLGSFLLLALFAFRVFREASSHEDPMVRQHGLIGYGIGVALLSAGMVMESMRTIAVSSIFWVLVGALEVSRRRRSSSG